MKFVKRHPRLRQHFSDSLDEGRRHINAGRGDLFGIALMSRPRAEQLLRRQQLRRHLSVLEHHKTGHFHIILLHKFPSSV